MSTALSTTDRVSSPLPPPVGRVWRRSKFAVFLVLFSILLLFLWLIGAFVLWRVTLFLPINYFGGGVEGDEDGWWTSGQYNTFISLAGDFVGAAIGYGIGHGFKAILRRRLLSPNGISIVEWDALADLSQQELQYKRRWTAVLAAIVFVVANFFGGATQAAFGTGVVQVNISVPFNRCRLAENQNLLLSYLPNITSALSASDEADANIDAVVASLSPSLRDVHATVLNTLEYSSPSDPLFEVQSQLRLLEGVYFDDIENNLTAQETKMLKPSRHLISFARVEGFFAKSTCSLFSPNYTASPSPTLNATSFSISFPCGTKEAYYFASSVTSPSFPSSSGAVSDVFICPDDSPFLFVYSASLSSSPPSLLWTYRCDLTLSSVLVDTTFSPLLRTAQATDPPIPSSEVELEAGSFVQLLGIDLLDDFGGRGWTVLQQAVETVEGRGDVRQAFLEETVETLMKVTLARVSYVAALAAHTGSVSKLRYEETESKFQVEALQLHLSDWSLFWFTIPLFLLALQLYVGLYLLVPSLSSLGGQTDFTDPTDVVLIALGSERDELMQGGGTGDFGDDDQERERRIRIRFGQRARKSEGGGRKKLELTTVTAGEVELRVPVEGVEYV